MNTETWWTGWRVRDADTLEAEMGYRAFWALIKENGRSGSAELVPPF